MIHITWRDEDQVQHIYVIRDEMEPKEGPYWSSHVDILIQKARMLELCIHEVNISEITVISKIKPHDLVLYRPTYYGEKRSEFCKKVHGLKGFVINRNGLNIGNKVSFFDFCQQHHIPTPKTWYKNSFIQAATNSRISKEMSFVIKKSESSQGKGVFRAYDIQNCLEKINEMEDDIIVQEFCEMEQPIYDIRLMMVGTKLVGAMKRVLCSDDPLEFRSNLSLGNSVGEIYIPSTEMIEYAQKIQKNSLLDWVGIDVIVHQESFLFLECNTSAGLKGISSVCPNIVEEVLLSLLERARTN